MEMGINMGMEMDNSDKFKFFFLDFLRKGKIIFN